MIESKRWTLTAACAALVLGGAIYGCSSDAANGDDDDTDGGTSSSSSGGSSSGGASGSSSSGGSSSGGSSGACTAITVGEFDIYEDEEGAYAGSYVASITPGAEDDFAEVDVYTANTGTFDLAVAPDDDYSTCEHCVLVYSGDKILFQTSGTLDITADSTPNVSTISGTLTNVKLVEVTIDPTTFVATPVAGGSCVTISNGAVDVDVVFEEEDGGVEEDAGLDGGT